MNRRWTSMRKMATYIILIFFFAPFVGISQDAPYDQYYDTLVAQDQVDVYEEQVVDESYFKMKGAPQKMEEREIDQEKVKQIKSEEPYWYADIAPEKKEIKPRTVNTGSTANFWNTLFWILVIGGFLALLVWFLSSGNISMFRRTSQLKSITGDEVEAEEDIFNLDYEREINLAINEGNYRVAVRLLYLQTLKELAERNIIRYSHEKTNSDYLFQLFKTRYYKNFFQLTRHFDYTWYGGFVLSPATFQIIQKDFSTFKQQLG